MSDKAMTAEERTEKLWYDIFPEGDLPDDTPMNIISTAIRQAELAARREAMEECAEICRLVTGDFEDSSDDANDFDFTLMSQGSDECTSQIRNRMKEQG